MEDNVEYARIPRGQALPDIPSPNLSENNASSEYGYQSILIRHLVLA